MAEEELNTLELPDNVVTNVLRGKDEEQIKMVLEYLLLQSAKDEVGKLRSYIDDLLNVIDNYDNDDIGAVALDSLINICGNESGSKFVGTQENLRRILSVALDPNLALSDRCCKALSNLSRTEELAVDLCRVVLDSDNWVQKLIEGVCNRNHNKRGRHLLYLSQVLGNLGQCAEFRKKLLDPSNDILQKVIPILTQGETAIERKGIASLLFNCLFDSTCHMTLLSPPFDILAPLLLPLAGPEELDDEDYDKMPLDLQYLPEDKTREEDPSIRLICLRSLLLLCASKAPRTFIRDHNSYYILREYHKWEQDRANLLATENVIDILIRTEEEIGVDDLSSLDVPDDLKEKFHKMDDDYINDV